MIGGQTRFFNVWLAGEFFSAFGGRLTFLPNNPQPKFPPAFRGGLICFKTLNFQDFRKVFLLGTRNTSKNGEFSKHDRGEPVLEPVGERFFLVLEKSTG